MAASSKQITVLYVAALLTILAGFGEVAAAVLGHKPIFAVIGVLFLLLGTFQLFIGRTQSTSSRSKR